MIMISLLEVLAAQTRPHCPTSPVNLICIHYRHRHFYYPSLIEQTLVSDEVGYSTVLIPRCAAIGPTSSTGEIRGQRLTPLRAHQLLPTLEEVIEVDKNNLWGGFGVGFFVCQSSGLADAPTKCHLHFSWLASWPVISSFFQHQRNSALCTLVLFSIEIQSLNPYTAADTSHVIHEAGSTEFCGTKKVPGRSPDAERFPITVEPC